jgi:hypothetical protein
MEEKRKNTPGPLSLSLFSLHVADRHELASMYPQCPVAETTPRQYAPKAAEPGFARARRQPPPQHATGNPSSRALPCL